MLNVTERAARLIDADGLKRLAEPVGELGRDARAAHRAFGAQDAAAWRDDRSECLALQSAMAADEKLERTLLSALRCAERLGDARDRVRESDADVGDLFRVKAFVHVAYRVASALVEAGVHRSCARLPMPVAELCECLRALDAGDEIRSRFVLEDRFDSEMANLRAAADADRARYEQGRASFVGEIEAAHGLRLRRDQIFVPSPSREEVSALEADDRLRLVRSEGSSRTYALVLPSDLETLHEVAASADNAARGAERRVLAELCGRIGEWAGVLADVERWIGRIDFLVARVRLAARFPSWPEPGESTEVERGWVPRIREQVERGGGVYQPQTLAAGRGVTLLSGPNMGGKTVALTLVGTAQYLAQLGYPAPAEACRFVWVDRMDYVGADLSNTEVGLSSFAGEMAALTEALAPDGAALLLIDELGRSTNPREGAALADAAIAELTQRSMVSVVVTHFPDVGRQSGVRALRVAGISGVPADTLRDDAARRGWQAALNSAMDFALVEDDERARASDALRIAELLGVPQSLIERAATALDPTDET